MPTNRCEREREAVKSEIPTMRVVEWSHCSDRRERGDQPIKEMISRVDGGVRRGGDAEFVVEIVANSLGSARLELVFDENGLTSDKGRLEDVDRRGDTRDEFFLALDLAQESVDDESEKDDHEAGAIVDGELLCVDAQQEGESEADSAHGEDDCAGHIHEGRAAVLDDEHHEDVVGEVGQQVERHAPEGGDCGHGWDGAVAAVAALYELATVGGHAAGGVCEGGEGVLGDKVCAEEEAEEALVEILGDIGDFEVGHDGGQRRVGEPKEELEEGHVAVEVPDVHIGDGAEDDFLVDGGDCGGDGGQEEHDIPEDWPGRACGAY
eukprot:Sdes_comp10247_c0_seq1m1874